MVSDRGFSPSPPPSVPWTCKIRAHVSDCSNGPSKQRQWSDESTIHVFYAPCDSMFSCSNRKTHSPIAQPVATYPAPQLSFGSLHHEGHPTRRSPLQAQLSPQKPHTLESDLLLQHIHDRNTFGIHPPPPSYPTYPTGISYTGALIRANFQNTSQWRLFREGCENWRTRW